jgi:hypothetical protein
MTTTAFPLIAAAGAPAGRRLRLRLVRAELLKLRRRRGLVVLSAALTVLPMLIGFGITGVLHATNPAEHGPAGGLENFQGAIDVLAQLGIITAILIGVTTGAGDLTAGVFKELVITGRSRVALFAARIPAGLLMLLPLLLAALAVAGFCSTAFSGSLPAPSLLDIVAAGAWVALGAALGFAMGLGVASLIGSRAAAITSLLAFQLAISPLLIIAGFLGAARDAVPTAALQRLEPAVLGVKPTVSMSLVAAILSIATWTVAPLLLGAWRTATRSN